MEAKKPTLEDVGRLAGVSRATASRVITSSRNVSGPSADRVRRAVELLGYEPDLAARALAKGRSSVVDLIVIDEDSSAFGTNPYYSRVVAGILEALSETEAQMRLHIVAEEDAAETIDHVARTAGVGALLVNVPPHLAARFHARCRRVVSLGLTAPGIASIEAKNVEGARDAVHHLIRTGRKRIAAVHGPHHNSCARGRKRGFRQAVAEAGLPLFEVEGDFCRHAGVAAARRLLATHPDVDAIFAACDLTATGVLEVLGEHGRRVPDDVALVGFDDSVLARCATPQLTSVRQPVEHIAAMATRALLAGEISAADDWQRIVPTSLTVRRSSAA
jgi:DNA-binding LacI/PurR family transcriptional regulator